MREHKNSTASGSAVLPSNTCRPASKRKTIARSLASGAFLIALAIGLGSSTVRAADTAAPLTKQQVKELIKTAKTPEDHMKLAQYYKYEADKLNSEAKDHQEMSAEYIHHTVPKFPTMSQHCTDLSGYLSRAAKKAEQLASMHEEMAKGVEK